MRGETHSTLSHAAVAVDNHLLQRSLQASDLQAVSDAIAFMDDALGWYQRFKASDVVKAGDWTSWLICYNYLQREGKSPEDAVALLTDVRGTLSTITQPCGMRPYDRQFVQARDLLVKLSRASMNERIRYRRCPIG